MLAVDLDGTLVNVNTFPRFTRFLVLRLARDGRRGAALRVLRAIVARKLGVRSHAHLKAVVCRHAPALRAGSVEAWAATLLARHLNPDVDALVRSWSATKVLTTAAPEVYARVIGRRTGFELVHGTRLEPAGLLDNSGEAKADRLRAASLHRLDVAVTDDPHLDAPLLGLAARGLLVDAEGRLRPA